MLRVIFQAAKAKLKASVEDVTYFDVRTGEAISGTPSDKHLAATIDTGCGVLRQMVTARPI
jgi:hypothetical protein